ncbi:hypothetical protein GND98_012160 [Clostridium butyricum]|uniref:Uncharacterized protein n=1 Tax=Clostridium butyricum TaxID=1492 RepID=A0A6L9EPL1_CLOBU|nr:hypothetical protein [Clostridium butyricum]
MGNIKTEIPKIPISFKRSEENIYKHIKSKRNASCYIKDLVEKDMAVNKEIIVEKQDLNKRESFNNDFRLDF